MDTRTFSLYGAALALLLCGSLGLFCPMMLPASEASSPDVHHTTAGMGMCLDSLLLSSIQNHNQLIHPLVQETPTLWITPYFFTHPIANIFYQGPLRSGPLRYLYLSTLLI